MPVRKAAELYRVSISFIYKLLYRRRDRGTVSASKSRGHRRRSLSPARIDSLKEHIEQNVDATLEEIQAWLIERFGIRMSLAGIWNTLEREGITYKKNGARRGTGARRCA